MVLVLVLVLVLVMLVVLVVLVVQTHNTFLIFGSAPPFFSSMITCVLNHFGSR
jgi:hypothetical protein